MDKPVSRQEFLQRLSRNGMLVGLTGLGAAALHGSRSVSECFNDNHCVACDVFSGCALPEKQEIAENGEVKNEREKDSRSA